MPEGGYLYVHYFEVVRGGLQDAENRSIVGYTRET